MKKSVSDQEFESELHVTLPLPGLGEAVPDSAESSVWGGGNAEDAEARLKPGSVLRDRYLLVQQQASGSMGVVFKAVDRHLSDAAGAEVVVAIKVLAPRLAKNSDALRALQQEAAKGRYLSHPGIVRFIDLDREGPLYFIVMEWLDGESLGQVLDTNPGAIDFKRVLDIVRQIADALDHAHNRGVIHADIKPGNVMLLPDNTAKLIDFGIARVRQLGSSRIEPTATVKAATPQYSSMQVLTGEEPVASDDVFSLACLTYRLATGHRVFGPRNAAEAAAEGLVPQRPKNFSDSQWSALKKALSFSRAERQQTPLEFVEGLSNNVDARKVDGPLVVPPDEVARRRFSVRASRWPVLFVLLLLAAAAGYLYKPALFATGIERLGAFMENVQQRAVDMTSELTPPDNPSQSAVDVPAVPQAEAPSDDSQEAIADAVDVTTDTLPVDSNAPVETDAAVVPSPAVADFVDTDSANDSPMPVGDAAPDGPARVILADAGRPFPSMLLNVIEDGESTVIELERQTGLSEPLLVRFDEVGFSGRRSPGNAGEYRVSDGGVINFAPGQELAIVTIDAVSNNDREPDRQVSLRLRDYYDAESVLAQLDLRLLDDDQRAFEANIPVNSISFATDRIVVSERDPAAQIDVLRYNPGNDAQVVVYYVRDQSAVEGEDYFIPTQRVVSFGPGQRNARLLISLVQDTVREGDERFVVELNQDATDESTIRSVSVIIRDDDFFAE
ncbi:MAG: protein kinase [Woeseia sp.]|nr:protein kinase [Woeseia sp.]MBT8097442.1 protein kinase [Woeseia sp.]NNE60215.1 protein kinase [Woeseia sp.]NNL53536.1 protein kinase [Woeseia sp.]